VEDFADLGTTVPKESYHYLRPSPMRPNELWTRQDNGAARAQAPDCQRGSCGSVQREEEEGTGIASDVVKVKGEDPGTPGCQRSVDTRKPRDHKDSPISD